MILKNTELVCKKILISLTKYPKILLLKIISKKILRLLFYFGQLECLLQVQLYQLDMLVLKDILQDIQFQQFLNYQEYLKEMNIFFKIFINNVIIVFIMIFMASYSIKIVKNFFVNKANLKVDIFKYTILSFLICFILVMICFISTIII